MGLIFVEGHINGKLAHKITVMHAWVHFHVNFDPRKFKSCLMVFTINLVNLRLEQFLWLLTSGITKCRNKRTFASLFLNNFPQSCFIANTHTHRMYL